MKYALLLALIAGALSGCVQTEISAQYAKAAYGTKDESVIEAELAKEGKLEEYKQIKARDAAVEAADRARNQEGGQQ